MKKNLNSERNQASLVGQIVKNLSSLQENLCLIPGSERSPGEGNGQYSCLENTVDRGDWWATVLEVAKSQM